MEEDVCAASFDEAAGLPELLDIEQVSDGWIKKYILTYRLPNGRELKYDVVSRKALRNIAAKSRRWEPLRPRLMRCALWAIRRTMNSCSFANSVSL